jgi:hypothetical protein
MLLAMPEPTVNAGNGCCAEPGSYIAGVARVSIVL